MNMAIDEAMAAVFVKDKMPPTLRLYQWESPALTLGAFQKDDETLRHFLEANAVRPLRPVTPLRRITGGQALLHDRDLTYSIIASTHDPLFSGGIKKTFYAIAQGLLGGLTHLGIHAEIHTPMRDATSSRDRSPFCASSLSWYEISVDGKKLIGSAQKRWPDHFLQHGSLAIRRSPLEQGFYGEQSITLYDLMTRLPASSEIQDAMEVGFETALMIRLERGSLTPEEKQIADHLVTEKYNNVDFEAMRRVDSCGQKQLH